ncbi:MAG TPA: hypothetical protein VEL51_15810 [Vicinamibacterales bacterium]|nr:hypothetical protein [Vicinamibacterales bacterium]
MQKVVWTAVLLTFCLAGAAPAMASGVDQSRRQVRVERLQELRERMQERRVGRAQRLGPERLEQLRERRLARIDRNHDGRISRREAIRHRLAVRRALRRAIR